MMSATEGRGRGGEGEGERWRGRGGGADKDVVAEEDEGKYVAEAGIQEDRMQNEEKEEEEVT